MSTDSPNEDEVPFQNKHKLCGFLCVVLSLESNQKHDLSDALPLGTYFNIFRDLGSDSVQFRSEDGIVLSPIHDHNYNSDNVEGNHQNIYNNGSNSRALGSSLKENKILERESGSSSSTMKKRKKMGFVNGSVNVINQLHLLTMQKCFEFVYRVVRVSKSGDGNSRVVLLVDVYLASELLSGWKFPKSGSIVASLFSHLSYNWERRHLMLVGKCSSLEDDEIIWNHSDCHVFGCKVHRDSLKSSRKRLFELHEIFKSLPGAFNEGRIYSTRINSDDASLSSGICELSDDVLKNILTTLGPKDLYRVAATCRHLRSLTLSIIPCMKLKLFPHQQVAIEWMLQREQQAELMTHPLYMNFLTEDGLHFSMNAVSGDIFTGIAPTIRDFCGGLFCDEPGLGKTITALSLILKTQGVLADPPDGVEVRWCSHNNNKKCGYYELSADKLAPGNFFSSWTRSVSQNARRRQTDEDKSTLDEHPRSCSPKKVGEMVFDELYARVTDSCPGNLGTSSSSTFPATRVLRCTNSSGRLKRNLFEAYEEASSLATARKKRKRSAANGHISRSDADSVDSIETWAQCDSCHKWRKLLETSLVDDSSAWFCSMNSDPLHQNCAIPEESSDWKQPITYLPGFCAKGSLGGNKENVSFFTGVLKDHNTLIDSETKKALTWLAKLPQKKLLEMERNGMIRPLETPVASLVATHGYHKIFQAFGLVKRVDRRISRWYYPRNLESLAFDVVALQIALTKPLNLFRLYLSRATLVVVPANLVDHWKTQIRKHVRPGLLRVFVWTDQKKPSAHNLAWDYDVVVTTFNRFSAEWGPRKRSVLMQIHWLRVILDEGHTLGSSLSLTNKLQMAISLTASSRWILTGTPTPNTPNSQVSHLQPMLRFLHEEVYGQNQKSWEAGILRPFEAELEEGRSRLLQLLSRCMISARKVDLRTIPPCIKKAVFLNFMEEHAKSYNELVVTVRRNILMADWNDPSHVESLLNPKQWKFRSTTIRNVRLSCCVAGHIKVTDAGEDIQDTMDILVEQGLESVSEEYVFIRHSLLYGCSCFRCKEWCRLPVITPCRHLLCLDCVAMDSEKCTFPGCGNSYEMQNPEILTRPENPNPKWPVPKDLIELQPSYKQDDWDPDWQSTSSSKVSYLVKRLKDLQEANRKLGYNLNGSNLSTPPEKVIIFSQFLEHIHVIEQQLTIAGIKFTGMYSPMHSSNKMKSLAMFQYDDHCMVLLMDGSAALGLDLSFVSHVFLMEPIWDRSMEEQVISRAHRMGATRPVYVETLAMRGTIEEQMLEFLQDANDCSSRKLKEEFRNDREGGPRAHRTLHDFAESNYLAQLSFVKTNSMT